MNQQSVIHLKYQCHEPSWKFKKQGKEVICKSCCRQMLDFTNMTEQEIVFAITNKKKDSCGIFYHEQVIIDKDTKQGPSLTKILVASAIASITTFTGLAQVNNSQPYKTEQNSINNISEASVDTLPEVECYQIPEEYSSEKVIENPNTANKYYLSWKFPFIHKRKRIIRSNIVMGFI